MKSYTKKDLHNMFKDPDNTDYKMQFRYDNGLEIEDDKILKSVDRALYRTKILESNEDELEREPSWRERNELLWQSLSKAIFDLPEKNPVNCFEKLFVSKFGQPKRLSLNQTKMKTGVIKFYHDPVGNVVR
jgi:hypothetical protein